MKLICSKANLLKGVNIVSKAVPSKTTMSILECILIDASASEIKFTANDMELGIETIVEGEILEKGIVAIDAKVFSEIVRKLPDNDVTIDTDSNYQISITDVYKRQIQCGFYISNFVKNLFTHLPDHFQKRTFQLAKRTLQRIIIFGFDHIHDSFCLRKIEMCIRDSIRIATFTAVHGINQNSIIFLI